MNIRRALGISALSQLIIFVVNFASVIVVSRLLTPEEVGIFSVSAAILTFAHIFREFGVGHFLIQTHDLTRDKIRAAFTVTLGISWTIAVLLFVFRNPLARFYGSTGIAEVLALIAINFLIMPFGSPLLSLLRREMQFDKIAIVNITNAVVSSAVTVAAAWAGMSYLSMGLGAIAGIATNVFVLNWIRRGEIFMLPTTRGLREVVRFGSISSAISIMGELSVSAPDLILGKTLGFSSVAYYSRANGIRKMATGQMLTLVRGVYFPSFAKKVREGHNPSELYSTSMAYMVAFTAPVLALLAVVAPELIHVLFGEQWGSAAPLASMLCASSIVVTPIAMVPSSLLACGHATLLLRATFLIFCVRLAVLATSIWFDLETVVMLISLSALFDFQVHLRAMRKAFGLRISTLLRALCRSLLLIPFTVAGPVLIEVAARCGAAEMPAAVSLAGSVALAVIGWIAGILLIHHPLHAEFKNALSRLFKPAR